MSRAERPRPRRGEIGLGDLIRAVFDLAPDDAPTLERIAAALGVETPLVGNEAPVGGAWNRDAVVPTHPKPGPAPSRPVPEPPLTAPSRPPPPAPRYLDTTVEELEPIAPPEGQEWLAVPPTADIPLQALPREPLLAPRTAPKVIAGAVSTPRPGHRPDLRRLVRTLIAGRPVHRIPRLPEATVSLGAQLLMDGGETMAPFREDLDDLAAAMERVVGRELCQRFEFQSDPGASLRWTTQGERRRWTPQRGRPVVLLTDLDIGTPAGSRDRASTVAWRRFTRRCAQAGAPPVAFTPLAPERWPRQLARLLRIVHWDRRTGVGDVQRLLFSAMERRR